MRHTFSPMSTLIFKLPPGLPSSVTTLAVVQVADGSTPPHAVDAPLGVLPDVPGAERVALVPAQRLSWHQVELPAGTLDKGFFHDGGSPRLRSVIEGLLEDRVLDDTALLHFAMAPNARTGAPTWVAVCDKAWLKAWLTALEGANRSVTRVVPEFRPPDEPDVAEMYSRNDRCHGCNRTLSIVTLLPHREAWVCLEWRASSAPRVRRHSAF